MIIKNMDPLDKNSDPDILKFFQISDPSHPIVYADWRGPHWY